MCPTKSSNICGVRTPHALSITLVNVRSTVKIDLRHSRKIIKEYTPAQRSEIGPRQQKQTDRGSKWRGWVGFISWVGKCFFQKTYITAKAVSQHEGVIPITGNMMGSVYVAREIRCLESKNCNPASDVGSEDSTPRWACRTTT
jgi:hypothetical protein